jgi:hypothetical protein
MSPVFDSYPSLDSALSARFRGHRERDWQEWTEGHYYEAAAQISYDAERAWVGRQKLNYQGIAEKTALKHLIAANADQPFLEEIGQLSELRRLELEWPFLGTELTPLLGLKQLEHLSIDSPRKLSDFSALLELPSLRTLMITNARRMANIEWLRNAHQLEVIGIEGAMDSSYKIESLAPLAGLRSLRAFLGVSTRLADKRLTPLAECPKLEYLSIARCAPRSEFELLYAARPDIVCSWFDSNAWGKAVLRATG